MQRPRRLLEAIGAAFHAQDRNREDSTTLRKTQKTSSSSSERNELLFGVNVTESKSEPLALQQPMNEYYPQKALERSYQSSLPPDADRNPVLLALPSPSTLSHARSTFREKPTLEPCATFGVVKIFAEAPCLRSSMHHS